MNSISFENFRKFAKFPTIDLGDVTVLVGGNNSGKSTVVKALLLCADNLLLMRMNDRRRDESKSPFFFNKPLFRFDANGFHDVKIKEFARAIYNKPVEKLDFIAVMHGMNKTKSLPTSITFKFGIGQFIFTFIVSGNRDERTTTGDVDCIIIEDTKSNVRYTNNYANHNMRYEVLNADFGEQLSLFKQLYQEFKNVKASLERANDEGDIEAISNMTSLLDKKKMQIKSLLEIDGEDADISDRALKRRFLKKNRETKATYDNLPLGIIFNEIAEPVVLNVISNIHNFATTKEPAPKGMKNEDPNEYHLIMEHYAMLDGFRRDMAQDENIFIQSRRDLKDLLDSLRVEYISTHAVNQNTLYNTADENDYIAQTVHHFWRKKINTGDIEYEFVREWMQRFEIGIDFKIDPIVPGEAYTVSVTEEDGNSVSLADKGMGSIQMMVLLLRLATILYEHRARFNQKYDKWISPIIVIEEPEQNLHPKMQSLLADLFYHLGREENCKFLIETHSEYLIRKSQVLVAEENFSDEEELKENNIFKVYYLPSDGTVPYEMQYRKDGCFANDFGEGFFDEAEKLAFNVL